MNLKNIQKYEMIFLPIKIIFIILSSHLRLGLPKGLFPVGLPVKIITDNSVETVVFGNADIPHPYNHTASQRSGAIYIYIYIFT